MNPKPCTWLRWAAICSLAAGMAGAFAAGPPTFQEAAATVVDALRNGKDLAPFVDPKAPCLFVKRFVDEGGKEKVSRTGPLPGAQLLKNKDLQERLRTVAEDMANGADRDASLDPAAKTVTYEGLSGYWRLTLKLEQTPAGWRIVSFEAYDEAP